MPRVALDDVVRIAVPVPTIQEQQRLGARDRELTTAAQAYRGAAQAIAELRQIELTEVASSLDRQVNEEAGI